MKYLCLILGVFLIAGALAAWVFYGRTGNDQGFGYALVGIAGAIIAGWGASMHEREIGNKG
jgi:uncharacterized membrane protein YeaQ/YmgE (transglycosylase-associated protein family)